MKKLALGMATGFALAFSLGMVSTAQASDTNIWLNLEGNPTCSSLGDNQAVLEMRDNDPNVGMNSISGNLVDADGNTLPQTQTINYEVVATAAGNKYTYEISSWSINIDGTIVTNENVNPVNYTILKARGNSGARVYHFGGIGEGAITDSSEESAPNNAELAAVSFCYGLSQGYQPPPAIDLGKVEACEDLGVIDPSNDSGGVPGNPADLYTAGVLCPQNGEELLIINMGLNLPNFGFDANNIRACTCNVQNANNDKVGLPRCNPDLPAVDIGDPDYVPPTSPEERSCMEFDSTQVGIPPGKNVPQGVNERVPFVIQGVENPDSYICYVIGGTRYCFGDY